MGRVRGLQAFALVALVSLVLVSVSEANRPDDQDSVLPLPFYLRSHDSSATIRSSTLRDRYSSSYHAYQLAVNSSNDADTPLIEHQLHLTRELEGVSIAYLESLISWSSIKLLTISQDVNLMPFKSLVDKVLARCTLEEVEIFQPHLMLDFSRQTELKRVVIDSSMLSLLPELSHLEDLAVMRVTSESLKLIESFVQVSRLSLSGDYNAVNQVNTYKFGRLEDFSTEVIAMGPVERSENGEKKVAKRSSFADVTACVVYFNDTWTNETLDDYICNFQNMRSLSIWGCPQCTKTYRMPTCIASYELLTYIYNIYMLFPNTTALPRNLQVLNLQSPTGTWTERDSGLPGGGSNFDWSWFPRLTDLSSLNINNARSLVGTLPNQFNNSKLTGLGLKDNHFTGTIAPDFFARYPALTGLNLVNNDLTGTIPNYGFEKLESLSLSENRFTHWSPLIINATAGFGRPSKLVSVSIDDNALVQIPDFTVFTALEKLWMGYNYDLGASIPNLFAMDPPRAPNSMFQFIDASHCGMTGSLPEIPESEVYKYNTTSIGGFLLNDNKLTGTIPTSWRHLKVTWFSVGNNPGLSGTIATISEDGMITNTFLRDAEIVRFYKTNITGPMLNITAMTSMTNLWMDDTNLDFCGTARFVLDELSNMSSPSINNISEYETILFPKGSNFRSCQMRHTNASFCEWAWPSVCDISAPIPPSEIPNTPEATPETTSEPEAPSVNPATPSAPTPNARPHAGSQALIPSLSLIIICALLNLLK